ncbi:integrase arm-type DNA-binding domain-containing protein [Methylomonas sp. DH-1]|uniref:tyrosine-type recombinase/integrase n=1 Tax=Methylomonas sp. (strain DH-1) TaxID=1727196 RepID=UPI0007C8BC47|nr:integrase arm-type DNA-binding domain-containing protein [Methylomonas sp. DH-1]ANE55930.1 integrase [Methylomonas sp. DH-1]
MAKQLLKDISVRNAKPADKDIRLNDGSGLYLLVKINGAKWWRFDYSIDGRRKTISLGVYPATSLADARRKADEARALVANGVDPSDNRKADKAARKEAVEQDKRLDAGLPLINSFEYVTRDWLASTAHTVRDITQQKKQRRFELYVFPAMGRMPIGDVRSPDVFAIVRPLILKNQLETAHRVRSDISGAFAYAIAHGFTDYDPAQAVGAQIPAQKVTHNAAITDPKAVGQLLRDIAHYQGTFVVQTALRLSPYLFQRPGEIRQMEWKDVDLAAREWRYFVTKTEVQHIVPLSRQAVEILESIKPLTGVGQYVFPSSRGDGRPMSDGTVRTALKSLGYEKDVMSAHGFRTTASTLLNEQGWSPDAIERQLCHMPKDQVRAAYNRAQYLDERRRMMQSWADYLDGLRVGADVIPFKRVVA